MMKISGKALGLVLKIVEEEYCPHHFDFDETPDEECGEMTDDGISCATCWERAAEKVNKAEEG